MTNGRLVLPQKIAVKLERGTAAKTFASIHPQNDTDNRVIEPDSTHYAIVVNEVTLNIENEVKINHFLPYCSEMLADLVQF